MKRLLYLPMLYHHDKGMWPPVVSSTSYFLWQKNLWEVFEGLEGWRVIWNAGQPNSNLYDPAREWRAKNVRYTSWGIGKALRRCDRVLVDFPSTAMWDAERAGKPYLCVTESDWWVRDDVKKELNPYIFYKNISEVEKVIRYWLYDQPWIRFFHQYFIENKNDWLEEVAR